MDFTKTGYIRYRELTIRREAARIPTLRYHTRLTLKCDNNELGDTLEIESTYKDDVVYTSRYKLVWNAILSRVVINEKRGLWLHRANDVGVRHKVHSVGVRPGASTP